MRRAASQIGSLLRGLPEGSLRRPKLALSGMLLIAALAGLGLARLELRTDGYALVPRTDPATLTDARVRDRFGIRDPIVVYLEVSGPDARCTEG